MTKKSRSAIQSLSSVEMIVHLTAGSIVNGSFLVESNFCQLLVTLVQDSYVDKFGVFEINTAELGSILIPSIQIIEVFPSK